MTRLNIKQVREKIMEHKGNVAAVARRLGVTRTSLLRFIQLRPGLAEMLQEAREAMLDDAESALFSAVRNGEAWAVCFILKTKGKARGYTERQEVTGKEGGPIEYADLANLTDEELDRRIAEAEARIRESRADGGGREFTPAAQR